MADNPEYPGLGRRDVGGTLAGPGVGLQPLPDLKDMINLSNAELTALLQQYGIQKPWPALVAQASKYNADMTGLSPLTDRAQLDELTDRLLDLTPREDGRPSRGLLGLARRTQESYTTLEAIGGDPNVELARVSEIDDASCAGCLALADYDGTYAEHQAVGLPGSQQCGANCRCQLLRIETE